MITKNTPLRDLIAKVDPDRNNIPENTTVGQLRERMKNGEQYYDICPVDSSVRETHFDAIAEAHNLDYDVVYNTRLHPERTTREGAQPEQKWHYNHPGGHTVLADWLD